MTDTDHPRTKARKKDPATSKEAAAAQTASKSQTLRDHLLRLLRMYGPHTDDQLAAAYAAARSDAPSIYPPVSPSGLRSRRAELVKRGLVLKTDELGTSELGMPAIVWKANPDAPTA